MSEKRNIMGWKTPDVETPPQHNDGERLCWNCGEPNPCGNPWGEPPEHNDGERVRAPEPTICKKHGSVTPPDIPCPHCRADALAEAVGTERVEQLVAEALDALEASGWVVPLHVRECLPGDIARALSAPEKGKG